MQARRPPGTAKQLAICDTQWHFWRHAVHRRPSAEGQASPTIGGEPLPSHSPLRGACPGACCKCNYAISYATEILLSSCLARAQKALPRTQGEQDVHLLLPDPPRNREELEGGWLRSRSILGLWRTLRRGPSGGWAATADDRLASKSWLWHCSEKIVCDYSGVPAGQCARNCCCIWSCWLLLAGWLYSYKPYLLGDNSNILGNYIWTNHWFSGDIRSFSGE